MDYAQGWYRNIDLISWVAVIIIIIIINLLTN